MKRLTESEIIERLRAIKVEPLEINYPPAETSSLPGDNKSRYKADLFINIKWESKIFRFIAEIKTVATPQLIQNAISQLRFYLEVFKTREFNEQYYPIIVTPYLSQRQIDELIDQKISGIDLSGNMILIVPGELFVLKSGNPNKYPSDETIKNVYRWSSSIVARVFLSKPEYSTVNEIYEEIVSRGGTITLGTVSKVLKTVEGDFLISRNSGIKLIDASTLLSKLVENYRPKESRRSLLKVPDLDVFGQELTRNCEQNGVRFAISQPQRYTVFPTAGVPTKIFVEDLQNALKGISFEETERFANIDVMETSEPSYYFDRQLVDGTYYTSKVQTYLDLMTGGKREKDAAEQVRSDILSSLKN